MSKNKSKSTGSSGNIALNKKARHEYFIEDKYEAGLELQGWEVKSLRAGKANIGDSYVIVRDGQVYLFGASFTPLSLASTHVVCDPTRIRKVLLHKREIERLIGLVERQSYTLIPLSLYWKKAWVNPWKSPRPRTSLTLPDGRCAESTTSPSPPAIKGCCCAMMPATCPW